MIRQPSKSILITDLYRAATASSCWARAAQVVDSGVNLIVLLAVNKAGRLGYDQAIARHFAALGTPVFACTPDLFPDLTVTALSRRDIGS